MNFQQLKYVRQAVRSNFNLTEVADTLFTSQSGVSKQIKDLEAELGIKIFLRKGKRLIGLTRAGEGVAALAERILTETENLRRFADNFARQDKGVLVVATTHNQARYTLPRVVQQFSRLYPDVELELRQGSPRDVAAMVIGGEADLAIATEALDQYPRLLTFPCFSWSHVVVAPRNHPLTDLVDPTLADIEPHPIITYSPSFSGRSEIDAAFEREGLKPKIRLTAMDADVIKTYVELGLGVGVVAEMAIAGDAGGDLVALRSKKPLFSPCVTKVAVQRGALLRSYAYRFIEVFAPHLKEADLVRAAGGPPLPLRATAKPATVAQRSAA
jgi:DNA-binding transcriptional LysR family regulator